MAKITRFNGDLKGFATQYEGSERTVFGDTLQSDSLDDNINTDWFRGWGIVGVNENPTKQDFNALGYTLSQLIAYLHQMGVAEYNAAQEYHTGSITQKGGDIFVSQTDNNTGNDPETDDGTNWRNVWQEDTVDSVATLRTSSFPANLERLYLSGYYGQGTPGGGDLYYDSADTTTADNGGTVFVDADGKRWKTSQTKILSPEMFGAKGDGTTDDLQPFKNAFEVLDAQGGGELICAPGKVYAVSSPSRPNLDIGQGTTLNLMGSEIKRIAGSSQTIPIIENRTNATRIFIQNGVVRGTGADNAVPASGQGHAILIWVGEAVIQDIETIDTDADGISTREADVKFVRITIGNYGRNGISPTSGVYTYDGVFITGTAFTGSSPGLAFDAENDSSGETGTHVINYIECDNMTFVDFYSTAGSTFNQQVTFIGGIVGWIDIRGYNVTAVKFVIGPDVTVQGGSSFPAIRVNDVSGVELKGCTIEKTGTSTSNVNAINLFDTVHDLLVDSVYFKPKDDGTTFTSSVFCFNATDVQNLTVKNTGATPQIYLKNVTGADISGGSGDILLSDTNADITVRTSYRVESLILDGTATEDQITFDSADRNRSTAFYSREVNTEGETSPLSVTVPLPSAAGAKNGRMATIIAQWSHKGDAGQWAHMMTTIRYGDTSQAEETTISNTNDGTNTSLSVNSATVDSVTIDLVFSAGGVDGNLSITIIA